MAALRSLWILTLGALAACEAPEGGGPVPAGSSPVEPLGKYGDYHVIYVPAYSHVYHGDEEPRRFQLTTTLSVHNISFRDSIRVHKIRYYDTDGQLVYDFLKEPLALRPMQTHKVRIARSDTAGGAGANFLVEWEAPAHVPAPIAEAVHIGVSASVGLSFVTRGNPLTPSVVPETFAKP